MFTRNNSARNLSFVLMLALLTVLAMAEDARVPVSDPNYRVLAIRDIMTVYDRLPAEPSSGRLVRESYFIWALSNYLLDSVLPQGFGQKIDTCANLAVFKANYLPEFDAAIVRMSMENPLLADLANILVHAVYRYFLGRYDLNEEEKERYFEPVRSLLESYRNGENRDKLANAFIREALTLIQKQYSSVSHYREYKQRPAGYGMFVLAKMNAVPYAIKGRSSPEQSEALRCSIPPIAQRESPIDGAGTVKVDGYFHPMTTFTQNVPTSKAFIGRGNLQVGTSEFIISLGGYLKSPAFLKYPYGADLELGENLGQQYDFVFEGPDVLNCLMADIRSIYVNSGFTISRDIRRLCDPADSAYSLLMELMVTNDHAELPNGMSVIEELEKYSPSEIDKYNDYLSKSEVFLVATYPKTVRTMPIAVRDSLDTKRRKSCEFLSPDFLATPQFHLLYLPREWLRHACYYGLPFVLFDYNLIGLGDLQIHPPADMPLGF